MKLEIILEEMRQDAHECNKRLTAVLRTRGETPKNAYCTHCGGPVKNRERVTCSPECADARRHQKGFTHRSGRG